MPLHQSLLVGGCEIRIQRDALSALLIIVERNDTDAGMQSVCTELLESVEGGLNHNFKHLLDAASQCPPSRAELTRR